MKAPRSRLIYYVLALAWACIAVWQIYEHHNVTDAAKKSLRLRANDLSLSLSTVIGSQTRFGAIRRSRLNAALGELAKLSELESVALQNPDGKIVASGGPGFSEEERALPLGSVKWSDDTLTVVDLVDLRAPKQKDGKPDQEKDKIIVVDSMPRPRRPHHRTQQETPGEEEKLTDEERKKRDEEKKKREEENRAKRAAEYKQHLLFAKWITTRYKTSSWMRRRMPPRPSNMSEEEFEAAFQDYVRDRGLHRFIMKLSAAPIHEEILRDRYLRIFVTVLTFLAAIALGLGWRSIKRSNDLQVRLIRAQEMNNHLQEMNLAAAGLAHETRNPLNVVRGLAQLISQSPEDAKQAKRHAETAMGEVDRVTESLNEFIEYSKPRSPKLAPTEVGMVVGSVTRALETDLQDKQIRFETDGLDASIDADEGLLRQLVFNLMLNAIQAVKDGDQIHVKLADAEGVASLTVSDSGPGVPKDAVSEIFRPYFTLNEAGTGLGLAVVRQIALAHGWDIDYLESDLGGAAFQITGIRLLPAENETSG